MPRHLYDRTGLLRALRASFLLDWHDIHGAPHWGRVRYHGLKIGSRVGANLLVVELFAFLHDSCRREDDVDPRHGARAADYAFALNGRYFFLAHLELEQLQEAIRHHSDGGMHPNPTIQTCWDADRLDLGRVGITPSRQLLSAAAAPFIEFAVEWSG